MALNDPFYFKGYPDPVKIQKQGHLTPSFEI
nr:MAG TPA: hypothetical protein [Caudoviricetes sp.]